MNLYAYVHNDPLNYTDPSGMHGEGEGMYAALVGMNAYFYMRRLKNIKNVNQRHAHVTNHRAQLIAGQLAPYAGASAKDILADMKATEIAGRNRTMRDPSQIRFSQDSIRDRLGNGTPLDDLINELKNGSTSPEDVDPIRVFTDKEGNTVSLDNRRLYAAQQAGVQVATVQAADQEVAEETAAGRKDKVSNSIRVRKSDPSKTRPQIQPRRSIFRPRR